MPEKIETPEPDSLEWVPDYQFTPQARHTYRQHGPYLICNSCELQHAVFIGMDKLMVGEDESGNPIVKKKREVMR